MGTEFSQGRVLRGGDRHRQLLTLPMPLAVSNWKVQLIAVDRFAPSIFDGVRWEGTEDTEGYWERQTGQLNGPIDPSPNGKLKAR